MDALKLIERTGLAPPLFSERVFAKFAAPASVPPIDFPSPTFASRTKKGRPHIIGHRGYAATYPENSLRAFAHAVEVGADALETDVHLSRDGVVVLSHDRDLKRCFGVDKLVRECDWSELSTLRTTRAPHEPMARLSDLLELLQTEGFRETWLVLDIKFSDEAGILMQHLARTLDATPQGKDAWRDRVLLAYWTAEFVPLCATHFPGFAVANTCFSPVYSREFLSVPSSGFSILAPALVSPLGRLFLRDVKQRERTVLAWTVNHDKSMDWCIRRGIDGVITDNIPKLVNAIEGFDEEERVPWPWRLAMTFAVFNVWITLFGVLFRYRHGRVLRVAEDGKKLS